MVQTINNVNEKATQASYLVSYQIPQRGEVYTQLRKIL